jgi:hypothetical protein
MAGGKYKIPYFLEICFKGAQWYSYVENYKLHLFHTAYLGLLNDSYNK